MSDYDRDRGAYTPPSESPLAFDPRTERSRGAGRPPTTLIISVIILLVLVAALVLYYRKGVRTDGAPPVVGAPLGDIKSAPPSSAVSSDEAAGLSIYKADQAPAASAAPPTFAPPPEQPLPRPTPAPTARVEPPKPLPAPKPAAPAASAPAAAEPKPALKPPVEPTPEPKPVRAEPAKAAPAAAGGPAMVQIGALSSPTLADKAWNDVARLMPGAMAGKTKKVEPVSKNGTTLYRAYIGGFASKTEAKAFCDQMKAAGKSCIVK